MSEIEGMGGMVGRLNSSVQRRFPWRTWLEQAKGSLFFQFTVTFALVALIVSLAAGFALSKFLSDDIRNKTLDDVAGAVSQVTARQIASHLPSEALDAPLSGQDLQEFDSFVRENILGPRIVRVNVWNRDGTIIYSTEPALRGQSFGVNEGVEGALAGEAEADVEAPEEGVEGAGLEAYDRIVEVYTPIRFDGSSEVAGAFEIYQDYSPIAAHIRDIQKSVYISIGVALGFLYLVLLFLVRRGSNLIRRQQADLQARSQELKSSYDSIVAVLCSALDLRDHVTHGHAQRVSELATVVAWQMGLRKEQVREIEKAAILHDIGKIGVTDAVLSKPGALTDEEWEEMRKHPELGYRILKDIDFLSDAAEIVYAHHERYDGSGYPRCLRGDEIPLGSRIFAVVDAYDAMTSHRPYRKAMSHHLAVEEVVRNSGTQFDPQVVKAFLEAERRGLIQGSQPAGDDVEAFFAKVTRQGRPASPTLSGGDAPKSAI